MYAGFDVVVSAVFYYVFIRDTGYSFLAVSDVV